MHINITVYIKIVLYTLLDKIISGVVVILNILAENMHLPENDENGKPSEKKFPFAIEKPERARREVIRVIAVGGGGGNAINHVISKGIDGVELLAVNTDARSLDMSLCKDTIILGERITKGLGAGAVPEIGEMAARESLPEIRTFLHGSDMVYFTAGMGGGTGTGALPVIAAAAKEMGILTVAVVTKPFAFEGMRKKRAADAGIEKLLGCVDALIVVPNDRLLDVSNKATPLSESFSMADEVLRQAILGVTNLITRPGMVNVDFADLKTVMKEAGPAVMGVGNADGENRISAALAQAVESPLMERSMDGAKGVLMNISYGGDLALYEIHEAASYIEGMLSDDATFIWGCVEDAELEGKVEIVIVATGIEPRRQQAPAQQQWGFKPSQQQPYARDSYPGRKQERLTQFERAPADQAQGFAAAQSAESAAPATTERCEPVREPLRESENQSEELIPYAPAVEKPCLISEMKSAKDSSWVTRDNTEAKIKTETDEFDTPSFTRLGRVPRTPDRG